MSTEVATSSTWIKTGASLLRWRLYFRYCRFSLPDRLYRNLGDFEAERVFPLTENQLKSIINRPGGCDDFAQPQACRYNWAVRIVSSNQSLVDFGISHCVIACSRHRPPLTASILR